MLNLNPIIETFKDSEIRKSLHELAESVLPLYSAKRYGEFPQWQATLKRIIEINPPQKDFSDFDLNADTIRVGSTLANPDLKNEFEAELKTLMPWRKGPFNLFGTFIDTEWRSDWKWNRLNDHLSDLTGRKVLDIGCGSGYHCWRMLGAGAESVLGIEPMLRFIIQFKVFKNYLPFDKIELLQYRTNFFCLFMEIGRASCRERV